MRSEATHRARAVRRLATIVAGGLVLVMSGAGAARAETIKLLTSWGANDKPSYANALLFKKNVEEISGGNIKVEISGPEVVPPFQQLQPVVAGVFDVLYTHGAYHAGSKGLALAGDAIDIDVKKRRDTGVWGYIDEFYQKTHKLKISRAGDHGNGRLPLLYEATPIRPERLEGPQNPWRRQLSRRDQGAGR